MSDNQNPITASTKYPDDDFVPDPNSHFTSQQQRFIKNQEPFSLVVAGAGTGKSTSLVGRLDDLINQQHVDATAILNLSFSNAAAKNLTKKYPSIQTYTFDQFITQQIHNLWPNMQLTEPESFANTIESYLNIYNNTLSDKFHSLCNDLTDIMKPGAFKGMNYNDFYKTLASILLDDQTRKEWYEMIANINVLTFELQTHIILDNVDHLVLPNNLKYLFVDEAQDTSMTQMRLILKMAKTTQANLAIIGDASQNLYEWRNVDTKTLQVIEQSGIFTNFKIETNFRSNDAILGYANQFLKVLPSNQQAQIQLTTPAPKAIDKDEFLENIKVLDIPFRANNSLNLMTNTPKRKRQIDGPYTAIYNQIISHQDFFVDQVQEWLKKGETVAFLSRKNINLDAIEDALERFDFVDADDHIITPQRPPKAQFTKDTLSNVFTKATRNLDLSQNIQDLERDLADRVHRETNLIRSKSKYTYEADYVDRVFQSANLQMPILLAKSQKDKLKYLNEVNHFLITEEVKRSQTAKKMDDAANNPINNAKLAIATPFAAKGFEYDHIIIMEDENNRSRKLEDVHAENRLKYVAVTRAKQTLNIYNFYKAGINSRSITKDIAGMFEHPYDTAYFLTLEETYTGLKKTNINPDNLHKLVTDPNDHDQTTNP